MKTRTLEHQEIFLALAQKPQRLRASSVPFRSRSAGKVSKASTAFTRMFEQISFSGLGLNVLGLSECLFRLQ